MPWRAHTPARAPRALPPLAILKVGSTEDDVRGRRGDFEDWFRAGLGWPDGEVVVVHVERGADLPGAGEVAAAVVTGSAAMVTERAAWSERCGAWLARFAASGRPLLAVCYGHQLLAQALGGRVDWNPAGREIGSCAIELTAAAATDGLFAGLPATFAAQTSHSQSVLALPPGAVHLARNPHDEHQAFRVGARAWGLQFHPEFDEDIVRGYVASRSAKLAGEGLDGAAIEAAVRASPAGPRLLARFGALARSRARAGG